MAEDYVVDETYQRILFRTAVLVMACDGESHADEVRELKLAHECTQYFPGLDFDLEMSRVREQLEADKAYTFRAHFQQLAELNLDPAGGLQVLELVLRIIYADQRVHENEIIFCQLLQQVLRVPEPIIERRFGPISFLAVRHDSEKKIDLASTVEFANKVSMPELEELHRITD